MARPTARFVLDSSTTYLLHRATQQAEAIVASRLAPLGIRLTPRQIVVLLAIRARPGASQTEHVAATGIDRSTLSEVLKRLTEAGLVRRERTGPDRRAYAVELTSAGRQRLRAALPVLARADRHVVQALGKARQGAFLDALERLVTAHTSTAA